MCCRVTFKSACDLNLLVQHCRFKPQNARTIIAELWHAVSVVQYDAAGIQGDKAEVSVLSPKLTGLAL